MRRHTLPTDIANSSYFYDLCKPKPVSYTHLDVYKRQDNEKPFVGMTNFKGNYVTKDDVKIAKNYLSEIELQRDVYKRQI